MRTSMASLQPATVTGRRRPGASSETSMPQGNEQAVSAQRWTGERNIG